MHLLYFYFFILFIPLCENRICSTAAKIVATKLKSKKLGKMWYERKSVAASLKTPSAFCIRMSVECAEPHCKIEVLSRKGDFLERSRWLSSVSHIDENVKNENRFKSNDRAFTTYFKILFRRIYPVKTRHAVNSQDKRTIKISRWKRRGKLPKCCFTDLE